jgi:hypothetical protein
VTDAYSADGTGQGIEGFTTIDFGTQTADLGSAISEATAGVFAVDQLGWYSVTYDLAFETGPDQINESGGNVALNVTGGTGSGAEVPFSGEGNYEGLGGGGFNVSDTQLLDCSTTSCQFSVQANEYGEPLYLEYSDITITQLNTSP